MEAVAGFFKGLWEDLTKKVDLDTKRVRQATISAKAPDEKVRQLLWGAMGAGGVLKPYAIGKFTGEIAQFHKLINAKKGANTFRLLRELLFVPQKEFSRIKTLQREFVPGRLGSYTPGITGSALDPFIALSHKAKLNTVWHEFTHARQYAPKRVKGLEEIDLVRDLFKGLALQKVTARMKGIDSATFYGHYNPVEAHAEMVGKFMEQLSSHTKGKYFESLYLAGLKDVVKELSKASLRKQPIRWD